MTGSVAVPVFISTVNSLAEARIPALLEGCGLLETVLEDLRACLDIVFYLASVHWMICARCSGLLRELFGREGSVNENSPVEASPFEVLQPVQVQQMRKTLGTLSGFGLSCQTRHGFREYSRSCGLGFGLELATASKCSYGRLFVWALVLLCWLRW